MIGFEEEDITDLMSPWDPPLSPSISTLFDQIENGQKSLLSETFSQPNIQNDQRIPSTLLQPEILYDFSQISPVPVTNNGPLETIQGSGADHATIIVSNNNVTDHQPMHVHDQPLQQANESGNVISRETHVEYDQNIANANKLGESSATLKRSMECAEGSNIGPIRKRSKNIITIQMETEENNPDDGYRWRKYGEKSLKKNSNPRSYYKCTYNECKVRKLVERGTGDIKLLMVTYDGKHEHDPPAAKRSRSRSRSKKSDIDQTYDELVKPPSRSLPPMDTRPPCPPSGSQNELTQAYITGLSKLPSLPVNQNLTYVREPINHNLVLRPHNDQLVNQNLSSLHQPVNHNLVNQNLGFVHQIDQLVNNNWSSMHQPINHNLVRMHQNDQLLNMNYGLNNDQI